jgi:hypothetical protein
MVFVEASEIEPGQGIAIKQVQWLELELGLVIEFE